MRPRVIINCAFLTAYERDSETDLDFAQDRFYVSKLGRFMSTDNVLISPARAYNPQLWNSYSYAGNNPLNFTDPNGMERIQLGRTEAEIQKDINDAKAKKKELEAQQKALKKEKKTLSAEEYSSRETKLKNDINQNKSSTNTLNTELNGTKIVNAMLKELNDSGQGNGLKLSDFSVSTDPANDFKGATFPMSIDNINAFVVPKADGSGPDYGGQIFINAKGPLWDGALNGGREGGTTADWILYGASILRHEQWHRDAPTTQERASERLAYQAQLPILKSFEHDFSNPSFYKKKIDYVTQRAR